MTPPCDTKSLRLMTMLIGMVFIPWSFLKPNLMICKKLSSVYNVFQEAKQQVMTSRKIHDIKLAFSEFYLSLILLQNYQTLNFTGFRKILKKHDKVRKLFADTSCSNYSNWLCSNLWHKIKSVSHACNFIISILYSALASLGWLYQ